MAALGRHVACISGNRRGSDTTAPLDAWLTISSDFRSPLQRLLSPELCVCV